VIPKSEEMDIETRSSALEALSETQDNNTQSQHPDETSVQYRQLWKCPESSCDGLFPSRANLLHHVELSHLGRENQAPDSSQFPEVAVVEATREESPDWYQLGAAELDPETIRHEAETEAAEKQSEIEARIRKVAEERFQERMEDMRKAQEEARKEIETARRKFEAEIEAAEEREKQEAEIRERAEEDAAIKLPAALKAEAEAKAAAEKAAAEEAARLEEIEEEAKRKVEAEAAAKVEKEKADAESSIAREAKAREAYKRYMQQQVERKAAKEKELQELQREGQRRLQENLINSGLDQDDIAAILGREKSNAPSETTSTELPRQTYTRMARRHLSIETLRAFRIDYDYDAVSVLLWDSLRVATRCSRY
jgi:hypothetical protein